MRSWTGTTGNLLCMTGERSLEASTRGIDWITRKTGYVLIVLQHIPNDGVCEEGVGVPGGDVSVARPELALDQNAHIVECVALLSCSDHGSLGYCTEQDD
eukprot:801175-Pyramimonas_sp.AAC.1